MEYTCVVSLNVTEFVKKVNLKISEGWKPQGGVLITMNKRFFSAQLLFTQAMVREDDQ